MAEEGQEEGDVIDVGSDAETVDDGLISLDTTTVQELLALPPPEELFSVSGIAFRFYG